MESQSSGSSNGSAASWRRTEGLSLILNGAMGGMAVGGKGPRWSWSGLLRPTGALTLVALPTPLLLPKRDSSFTANLPRTLADLYTEQDPTQTCRAVPHEGWGRGRGQERPPLDATLQIPASASSTHAETRASIQPSLENSNMKLIITVQL